MAGIVENNVVKMEWEKDGWLQTSAKKGKPTFILASKDYTNANGEVISVIFTSTTAFVFADDFDGEGRDIWSAADLIATIKSDMPGNFPYGLEQYVAIIESGEDNCKMNILETLGLVEYKDDIEARMKDIQPFGYEEEFKM